VEGDSNHALDPEGIIAVLGLQKPIEKMHPNIRDDVKREYVLLGPCQTNGFLCHLPISKIGYDRWRWR
jgi:hypothetical protein